MDHAPQKKQLSLAGQFYRHRDDWIAFILRRPKADYSHVEKLVAIYIVETINPESREWITSQERIAADMEIGIRVVKSAVSKLRKDGLLKVRKARVGNNPKLFNSYSMVPVAYAEPER